MAQWTVSRTVYLYIAALEVNVLYCREWDAVDHLRRRCTPA